MVVIWPLCLVALAAPPLGESRDSLEEVVVEGEKDGTSASPSASVTIIEIDESTPANADLSMLVERSPGTVIYRLGGLGDYSAVSIRGSTTQQVEVFIDGLSLNPEGAVAIDLSELPLGAFSKVEVYRSNPPASFGSSSIGGAINLVSLDQTDLTDTRASLGTLNTYRGGVTIARSAEMAGRPTDYWLAVEGFSSAGDFGYFDDGGTPFTLLDDRLRVRENNDKRQLGVHGRWRWGDHRLRLTLMDALLSRESGIPGRSYNSTLAARYGVFRNLTALKLETKHGAFAASQKAWLVFRRERLEDKLGEIGVGNTWTSDRALSWGATTDLQWAPLSWFRGEWMGSLSGDGFARQDLILGSEEEPRRRVVGKSSFTSTFSLFSDRLVIQPMVQGVWVETSMMEQDSALGVAVPRIGLLARPLPELQLKVNGGRAFRPPNFTELFGNQGNIVGHADLLPEKGWFVDVGARLELEPLSVEMTAFWNQSRNLIVYVQNSQQNAVAQNLGRARVQGLELAVTADIAAWVDVQANATVTDSRNLTAEEAYLGNQLPRIPAWELQEHLSFHYRERLRLGHSLSWVSNNYWDATNWYRSTPRFIHGLFVRVQPLDRWPSFELDILNVGNRIVEVVPADPLDSADSGTVVQSVTDFVGYPLPGRTLLFTIRWTR
ncbi:MAG: TonB-dependent receptor [Proteobacteria bacterium]|nr:TonB-dependent receptor [Pseudomonadota bacterium]